jgi:tRNA pseudouridine38-40 synthase
MRVALRVGYWGPAFRGYARQPGRRTVEGDLLQALHKVGALPSAARARLRVASRTDRGVSAVGNVVACESALPAEALPRALTDILEDVWVLAAVPVDDAFNPRHATERRYRYHLDESLPLSRLRAAARLFVGAHDFAAFTLGDGPPAPRLDAVVVARDPPFVRIDLRAPRFSRGLVRRVVGTMADLAAGRVTASEVRKALDGGPFRPRVAPPEPLFLMDVRVAVPLPRRASWLRGRLTARWRRTVLEGRLLDHLGVAQED